MEELNSLLTIRYITTRRIVALLFWLICLFFLGIVPIVIGLSNDKILFTILGFIIFSFSFIKFFDILFFTKLEFYKNYLVKEWIFFGKHKLVVNDIRAIKGNGIFGGTIIFARRWRDRFIFGLDLLPLNGKDIANIKQTLMTLNILKGDENDWND